MTVDSFLRDMEGYYQDAYGDIGRRIMGAYLGKLNPDLLPYLYAEVLKSRARSYKAAPGVAELEEVRQAARQAMKSDEARERALDAPNRPLIPEDLLQVDMGEIMGRILEKKKLTAEE